MTSKPCKLNDNGKCGLNDGPCDDSTETPCACRVDPAVERKPTETPAPAPEPAKTAEKKETTTKKEKVKTTAKKTTTQPAAPAAEAPAKDAKKGVPSTHKDGCACVACKASRRRAEKEAAAKPASGNAAKDTAHSIAAGMRATRAQSDKEFGQALKSMVGAKPKRVTKVAPVAPKALAKKAKTATKVKAPTVKKSKPVAAAKPKKATKVESKEVAAAKTAKAKLEADAVITSGYIVLASIPSNDVLKRGLPLAIDSKTAREVKVDAHGALRVGAKTVNLFDGYPLNKFGSIARTWYNGLRDISINVGSGIYLVPEANVPAYTALRTTVEDAIIQHEKDIHYLVTQEKVPEYLSANGRCVFDLEHFKTTKRYLKANGVEVDVSRLKFAHRFVARLLPVRLDKSILSDNASEEAKKEAKLLQETIAQGLVAEFAQRAKDFRAQFIETVGRERVTERNVAGLKRELALLRSLAATPECLRIVADLENVVENPEKYVAKSAGKEASGRVRALFEDVAA